MITNYTQGIIPKVESSPRSVPPLIMTSPRDVSGWGYEADLLFKDILKRAAMWRGGERERESSHIPVDYLPSTSEFWASKLTGIGLQIFLSLSLNYIYCSRGSICWLCVCVCVYTCVQYLKHNSLHWLQNVRHVYTQICQHFQVESYIFIHNSCSRTGVHKPVHSQAYNNSTRHVRNIKVHNLIT